MAMSTAERRESPYVPPVENRSTFAGRIERLFPPASNEYRRTMMTYDKVKAACHGGFRIGLERSFEHPRRATIIAIDELGITDPDIIDSLLLHDTGEDTNLLGPSDNLRNSEWREIAHWRLVHDWNERVAEMVLAVTRPFPDGIEVKTKEQEEEMYQEQLRNASFEALIVKMPDSLHNLRTLHFRTPENQIRKMAEIEEFYFPIFERGLTGPYARETQIMLDKMRAQIAANRERLATMEPSEILSHLDPYEKLVIKQMIDGVAPETTRAVYRYDADLIRQTRIDIMNRLSATNELDAVRIILERGLLTFDEVDHDFNPFAYQSFTGKQRMLIDALIDPRNVGMDPERLARLVKKRNAKELRNERDQLFGRLRVKNVFQLLAVVHYIRSKETPQSLKQEETSAVYGGPEAI